MARAKKADKTATKAAKDAAAADELPAHLERLRTSTSVGADIQTGCHPLTSAGSLASVGVDNALDLKAFERDLDVRVVRAEGDEMEFDLVGVDASFANALRRVLIAEVPTMAIEYVFIKDNTSVIPDEVLSHRLGLVPLRADPRNYEFVETKGKYDENNSIMFKLDVSVPRPARGEATGATVTKKVTSGDFEWRNEGSMWPLDENGEPVAALKRFTQFSAIQNPESDGRPPGPVSDGILLAKLRPGQGIELEALAVKGVGKDHAKFSPVATAFYRLLPEVEIVGEVLDEDADKLVKDGDPGLFGTEPCGKGHRRAVVLDARKCTMSRNCLREEPGASHVRMGQRRDHFIFSVESTGALTPAELVSQALDILKEKAKGVREALAQ